MFQRSDPGTAAEQQAPEYFFDDFRLRVMDAGGRPEYVLGGERLVRLAGADASEIDAPRLRITREPQTRWDVEADRGWLYDSSDLIRLRGAVVLERAPAADGAAVNILTEALDVDTADSVARTDVAVVVHSDTWRIESVGMVARFDDGLLDLMSQVHGTYRPPEADQ